jgi:hypothetical protein
MTDGEIDVITYDIWSDIDLSHHRGDKDARETIRGLESRILKGAADLAVAWFNKQTEDSGVEDNPAIAQLRHTQRMKLRAAILGTASAEKTDKGEI